MTRKLIAALLALAAVAAGTYYLRSGTHEPVAEAVLSRVCFMAGLPIGRCEQIATILIKLTKY